MSIISYLMLFSVVRGLVAVLALVILSESNSESRMVENKVIYILSIPLVLTISIFTSMEVVNRWSILLINQLISFSRFSIDVYLHIFLFIALIILIMLFVVDLILITHGGSILPIKYKMYKFWIVQNLVQ